MSGSGKAGNGRGNNRRRPFRHRDKDNETWQSGDAPEWPSENHGRRGGSFKKTGENFRRDRVSFAERPKWIPPKINTEPLPVPDCPFCGKPIRDISSAIADKDTGVPVHFDCVSSRIAGNERLERGDFVSYIGGGRFAIVNYGSPFGMDSQGRTGNLAGNSGMPPPGARDFRIKKIIEWENKEKRADWRSLICEHYSVT